MPPASANWNGKKPTRRRACEMRDDVREGDEQERHERDERHGERAAHDERRPAPARGEAGQRDEQQRRDGNQPGAREHVRHHAEAVRRANVELALVEPQRPETLGLVRRDGGRVAGQRQQPDEEQQPREARAPPSASRPPRMSPRVHSAAHEHVPGKRHAEEDGVGGVHDGEHEGSRAGACEQPPRRTPGRGERQRERRGYEQLARRGRGERQRRVRAAVPRRHGHERHRCCRGDERRHDPAEQRPAGLEPDEHRHRREDARQMADDVRRIDARHGRNERQQPVPEREGVPRVEASVRELVQRVERQVAEVGELAHAGEMEQPVAAHLAGDVPEEDAEQDAAAPQRRAPRAGRRRRRRRRSASGSAASPMPSSRTSVSVSEPDTTKVTRQRGEDRHQPPGERRRRRRGRPSARAISPARVRARPPSRARAGAYSSTPLIAASRASTSPRAEPVGDVAVRRAALAAEQQRRAGAARRAGASARAPPRERPRACGGSADARGRSRGTCGRRARRRRRGRRSPSGVNTTSQPRSAARRHQSVSSLKRKKSASKGPTSSSAERRTSMHEPIVHSTARSLWWSKPAP